MNLPATDQDPPVQVTLVRLVDPAQGADQFATPVPGARFVGAQLSITIGGNTPVFMDVSGDALLEDSEDGLDVPVDANLVNCPALNLGPTLAPGKTVTGCLTFQISADARVSDITFTPRGQFGILSAEWKVS